MFDRKMFEFFIAWGMAIVLASCLFGGVLTGFTTGLLTLLVATSAVVVLFSAVVACISAAILEGPEWFSGFQESFNRFLGNTTKGTVAIAVGMWLSFSIYLGFVINPFEGTILFILIGSSFLMSAFVMLLSEIVISIHNMIYNMGVMEEKMRNLERVFKDEE